jgi:hypothetical protein
LLWLHLISALLPSNALQRYCYFLNLPNFFAVFFKSDFSSLQKKEKEPPGRVGRAVAVWCEVAVESEPDVRL